MYQFRTVTDRIARMRKRYRDTNFTLDAERTMIATEFHKTNKSLPAPLFKAQLQLEVCSRMTVRVEDDELIVGNLGKNYKGTTLWPEYSGMAWLFQELDDGSFYTRKQQDEPMNLPEEEKALILSVRDYWTENTLWTGMAACYPDGTDAIIDAGVLNIGQGGRGRVVATGHLIPNYGRVIEKGFGVVRQEALEGLSHWKGFDNTETDPEKYYFYKSIEITCDAYITLARRYAAACREKAVKTETDGRRLELLSMADSLDWIAEKPARTFREAVQATYLYQLFLWIDGNYQPCSFGRFDQYTYPCLKRDLEAGTLTLEQAQEIVDCFWLKVGCLFNARLRYTARVTGAYSTFQHLTLGGCDRNGEDATNPITYMGLEAAARLQLHEPPVSLRVGRRTPDTLYACAIESSKRAGGVPCFQNEDLIIDTLVEGGYYSLEDARDFGIVGCQEIGGAGNDYCASQSTNSCADINLANVILLSINDGVNPLNKQKCAPGHGHLYEMESFEEVQAAFRANVEYFANWLCVLNNCLEYYHRIVYPVPALSAMLDGCVESGVDCTRGGAKYNSYGTSVCGTAVMIDSLIAIKYLIYDRKLVSAKTFYDALMADWEGYEDLRQQVKNMPHRYGNGDPYADEIAKWAMETLAEIINSRKMLRGRLRMGVFSASAHVVAGTRAWATPDGRKYGEPLTDAASPSQGADRHGPTAVLKSVCSYNHKNFSNGFALNLRFSPKTLAGEDGVRKLKQMMQTYFNMGGMEVQYNIVSSEELRAAQRDPETYRDLVVRVAGFSAYFVELATGLQNDIIARTENEL